MHKRLRRILSAGILNLLFHQHSFPLDGLP